MILLFAFLPPAVTHDGVDAHRHPGEDGEGEGADEDVDEQLGDSAYSGTFHTGTSLRQEIVIGEGDEIVSRRGLAAERLAVAHLLDVAQTAGDALVAVGVEGEEVQRDAGVAPGVDLTPVEDGLDVPVHDLRSGGGVGVDEPVPLVGFVVAFGVAVAQRQLDGRPAGLLPAEFSHAFLDGGVDRSVDGADGLCVRLRDEHGYGVFLRDAVDGHGLPAVEVGQAGVDARDDFGPVGIVCHFNNPP